MIRNGWLWVLVVLMSAGALSPAPAQEMPGMGGPPGERKVEQLKKIRLQEVLKLDEETSIRFFARYNKHQDAVRELQRKMNDAIDEIEAMRKRDADGKEWEPLLKELRSRQSEMSTLRQQYIDQLREVLTPGQVADYVVFERNFYRNLRKTVGDIQRERFERRRR